MLDLHDYDWADVSNTAFGRAAIVYRPQWDFFFVDRLTCGLGACINFSDLWLIKAAEGEKFDVVLNPGERHQCKWE